MHKKNAIELNRPTALKINDKQMSVNLFLLLFYHSSSLRNLKLKEFIRKILIIRDLF